MHRFLLLAMSLAVMPAAHGQIYEWRDADGRIHYTDRPPPEVDGRVVSRRSSTPPASAPPPPAQSIAEKEMAFRERRTAAAEAKEKKAKEAQEASDRATRCEQARKNLKVLDSFDPLRDTARVKNPDGTSSRLDKAGRDAEREAARKAIERDCK